MKEISKETVVKIRAMYLGQEVFMQRLTEGDVVPPILVGMRREFLNDKGHLSLRSIQDLTDKEAIKILLLSGYSKENIEEDISFPITFKYMGNILGFKNDYATFNLEVYNRDPFDYLQQIGIALPFYDLSTDLHYSVEDLIENGVYKIKTV